MTDILHIYAQDFWHCDATIAGTKSSLLALRRAVDAAIKTGIGGAEAFVNDGEGFHVCVMSTSEEKAQRFALPYIDDMAFDDRENIVWPHREV